MRNILIGLLAFVFLTPFSFAQTFFSLKENGKILYQNCGNVLIIHDSLIQKHYPKQKNDEYIIETQPITPQKIGNFKTNRIMLFPTQSNLKAYLILKRDSNKTVIDSASYQVIEPPAPKKAILAKNNEEMCAPKFFTTQLGDKFFFKLDADDRFESLCPTEAFYKVAKMNMTLHLPDKNVVVYTGDLSEHNAMKGIEFNLGGDIYKNTGSSITISFSSLYRVSFAKQYFWITKDVYASYTFLIE